MCKSEKFEFKTQLLAPVRPEKNADWNTFIILPKSVSELLPRRGRTSVRACIDNQAFQATLEPDGQLSHWLKVPKDLQQLAGIQVGDNVNVEISTLEQELEPQLPVDFSDALSQFPEAKTVWEDTTTIARVDWIHWIESAKQAKTRVKRINDACDMLSSGKRRVCCFDQSGFYSKSLSSPKVIK